MIDYFGEVFCALPRCTGRRLTSVAKTDRVSFHWRFQKNPPVIWSGSKGSAPRCRIVLPSPRMGR